MRPADLRNATWHQVLTHVTEDMVRVHLAWAAHGPGTTRQVASRSGISLLTLRPRTTDLHKLGLVELHGSIKGEGIYRYVAREHAEAAGHWRTRADFRGSGKSPSSVLRPLSSEMTGFTTVDEAVASMPEQERAALGARLMSQYGHHLKRRQPGAGQLELLPA